jgi:RNA polymerase sigma-70 factor (ECF subfamily)
MGGSHSGAAGRRSRRTGAQAVSLRGDESAVPAGTVTPLSLVRPSFNRRDRPDGDLGSSPDGTLASEVPPVGDAAVAAAKKGEPAAWEVAYRAYGKALMGYLMVRLENQDDASEALSETFTRAITKVSGFRGDSYAFRAWLFTIARNVSTDQHRRRARVVVVADHPDTEDRGQPSNEDIAVLNEDLDELRRGFARLPQADQEVLWLRVCTGLSAQEVGEVVGKRSGAVRMQQMRALEALRSQVGRPEVSS